MRWLAIAVLLAACGAAPPPKRSMRRPPPPAPAVDPEAALNEAMLKADFSDPPRLPAIPEVAPVVDEFSQPPAPAAAKPRYIAVGLAEVKSSGGGTQVTLKAGSKRGVSSSTRGYLTAGGNPIKGSWFTVSKVDASEATAVVAMPLDKLKDANGAIIALPPKDEP